MGREVQMYHKVMWSLASALTVILIIGLAS